MLVLFLFATVGFSATRSGVLEMVFESISLAQQIFQLEGSESVSKQNYGRMAKMVLPACEAFERKPLPSKTGCFSRSSSGLSIHVTAQITGSDIDLQGR